MADIVVYDDWVRDNMFGCKMCENMMRIGKNTYTCAKAVSYSGESLYPIVDGEKTDDYNACEGEFLKRKKRDRRA